MFKKLQQQCLLALVVHSLITNNTLKVMMIKMILNLHLKKSRLTKRL